MDVILAGMNIDIESIREFQKFAVEFKRLSEWKVPDEQRLKALAERFDFFIEEDCLTPETLSAAYARISRDSRTVDQLRKMARKEVKAARRSNENIVFGLGHSSVAEHAVFNVDVINISRYAVEFIEHFRLSSFTEKSQRYVTFKGDYTTPVEIVGTKYEKRFDELIEEQNSCYKKFYKILKEYFFGKHPDILKSKGGKRHLENLAKEDARYSISLATHTQLGMTINARSAERMIQQAFSHPLGEIKEFGSKLLRQLQPIAPSLVKYTEPEEYHFLGIPLLKSKLSDIFSSHKRDGEVHDDCRLLNHGNVKEGVVIAALAHENSKESFNECLKWANNLDDEEKKRILYPLIEHIQPYHSVPRAFEFADFVFEFVISASCFAQIKRHRMSTITAQMYDPELGITVPPSIKETCLNKELERIAGRSADLCREMSSINPEASIYALTNAHRRRVLMKANMREWIHFSRLRMDKHAQWDIRALAHKVTSSLKARFPVLGMFLCGKDRFEVTKREILRSIR